MKDSEDTLRALELLRDDLWNVAVINNPQMFAAGYGTRRPQAKTFVTTGDIAVFSAVQTIYVNKGGKPVVVYLRGLAADTTEFVALFGASPKELLTVAQAPGVMLTRMLSTSVVVQPNQTLVMAVASATANVAVTATILPLRGSAVFPVSCMDERDLSRPGKFIPDDDTEDDEVPARGEPS